MQGESINKAATVGQIHRCVEQLPQRVRSNKSENDPAQEYPLRSERRNPIVIGQRSSRRQLLLVSSPDAFAPLSDQIQPNFCCR
jgi:hypothetical protein